MQAEAQNDQAETHSVTQQQNTQGETQSPAEAQNNQDETQSPKASKSGDPGQKKKKFKGRSNDLPDVHLSKTLSYILRHGALKEGLLIRSDGFIKLEDVMARPKLKGFSLEDIHRIVAENEKQRFAIAEESEPGGTNVLLIRANQGHSLQVQTLDLKPITSLDEVPVIVHGTYTKFWPDIVREGLRPMSRNHIHFAKGLFGETGVISGMRASCDIFIYLDVEKCFTDNIAFFRAANGVILSEGLESTKNIPKKYFKQVTDKAGTILFPGPEVGFEAEQG